MAKSHSTAYDMSLFESRSPRLRAVKSPEKAAATKHKKERYQRILRVAGDVVIVGLLIAVLVMMIVSRAELTELSARYNELKEEESHIASVQSSLDNAETQMQSAETVDAYANAQAMEKVEYYQIEYITVDGGDKIEVSDPAAGGVMETIGAAIAGWFGA